MAKSRVVNKIKINGNQETVFKEIWECEKWPLYSPGCLEVEVLERKNNWMLRYLKADINYKIFEMKTECEYFPPHLMKFKQVKSPYPLSSNTGEWTFRKLSDNETEVVLVHNLESNIPFTGWIMIKFIMPFFYTYKQSQRVLKKLKERIEKKEYLE